VDDVVVKIVKKHAILITDIAILSLCLSHSNIVSKWLNISSQLLHYTVAQSFWFYEHQTSLRNSIRVTAAGMLNTGKV